MGKPGQPGGRHGYTKHLSIRPPPTLSAAERSARSRSGESAARAGDRQTPAPTPDPCPPVCSMRRGRAAQRQPNWVLVASRALRHRLQTKQQLDGKNWPRCGANQSTAGALRQRESLLVSLIEQAEAYEDIWSAVHACHAPRVASALSKASPATWCSPSSERPHTHPAACPGR